NGKYFASAYYSLQAAEKALKAYLIYLGKGVNKTHSLTPLISYLEKEGVYISNEIKEDAMIFSPFHHPKISKCSK
ncbi:MAG TPA: HEPN domain-containing protein, partial [Geobacterales bacterium]|nr:HEPN domain-containing protein [Geobacterales bacterium]